VIGSGLHLCRSILSAAELYVSDSPAEPPLRSDRFYGAVALVLVLVAAFFAIRGGESDGAVPGVPRLSISEPVDGAQPPQPVSVVFESSSPLRPGPSGWSADGRHVHLRVAGSELMASGGEVQPLGGNRYRWLLPRLPEGSHTVQLFWSDSAHQALRAGASPPVRIQLR
jgi:hypothetical protein